MTESKSNAFDVISPDINTAHDPRPLAPCRRGMDRQTRRWINPCWEGPDMTAVVERLPLEALARDS